MSALGTMTKVDDKGTTNRRFSVFAGEFRALAVGIHDPVQDVRNLFDGLPAVPSRQNPPVVLTAAVLDEWVV